MIPTSTNSGAFQQLLAVSTSLRSQMQSVVLVRSHHKHTHLVGRSFSCLFLSPAFSHCDAQAESWRLCFWIHNLQQALCHSLEILWESIELHSLRHRSIWISKIHRIRFPLLEWRWVRSGCVPNLPTISSSGTQTPLAAVAVIFLKFQNVVQLQIVKLHKICRVKSAERGRRSPFTRTQC